MTEHQVDAIVRWTQYESTRRKKAEAAAKGGIHLTGADLVEG